MITRLLNSQSKSISSLIIRNPTKLNYNKSFYSTSDEIRLKTKVPIFRQNDENADHLSIGKLRESEHSVALVNLEFIKIDSIVNLTAEELNRLVVIPKTEKISPENRIEKLENDIKQIKEQLDRLLPKSHNTAL
ncbi:hypothetical protein DDB_G0276789 [Dictyostelium discoideum AX4]|uniref:Uncharacterized protein n=1 Tax=Dictyostelium discoideum TaxID=44689 RepID=Q7KWW3_DICDI|nr:hypothetical protein DDB_G0276789 [Dictyostelium discoideum AX4]EAL68896.1 hypothetical protein DDB_G0276789 [Dictyostelium discoideum AX4]|eukprot:XP_642881.1 hypothetical protein DDB_G0276789 [Dictyostelium discoideum AX4]